MKKLDMMLFEMMFPTYREFKVPMWSDWTETEEKGIMEIAIPGYDKKDFELYVENGILRLKINDNKKSLSYSIVDSLWSSKYLFEKSKAEYVNGILKITIPKTEKSKKRIIEVS
jgi:HSP20 family protein